MLSDELRSALTEMAQGTPWGVEANIETAEQLARMGVDEDSILESIRATHEAHKRKAI